MLAKQVKPTIINYFKVSMIVIFSKNLSEIFPVR